LLILLAGAGILTSNAYMDVVEEETKSYVTMASISLWFIIAYLYMIERSNIDKIKVALAITGIWVSSLNFNDSKTAKILYVISWLYFGYLTGLVNGKPVKKKMMLGLSAAVLMIIGNFVFLPIQKLQCRVEGPGMMLKGIAISILAYANV
jgi:threonine/homoserine efflux transporter RhtA